ncbi:MAG TPA: hypothetical protein VNL14_16550 [Candidatus Acidoferrales bacterium]|nr:hypothetical protein [Candidatus Acidoferrales bacterium]
MKFKSGCKTAEKLKTQQAQEKLSPETIEWFKNLHVPSCKVCSGSKAPVPQAKPKTKWDRQFTVRSFSDPDKTYRVSVRGKVWVCSCPSYVFRHEECKHIEKLRKAA